MTSDLAGHGAVPMPMVASRALIGMWPEMRRDVLQLLIDVSAAGDDLAGFRLGPRRAAVLSSPDVIRDVLIDHPQDFEKGEFLLRVLRPVLGDGLLVSEGQLHTRQRRMVAPLFGARQVRAHVGAVVEEARRAVHGWADGAEVDLLAEMNALAMDIIGRILFDARMRDEHRLADAVTEVFEWEMRGLTSLLPLPPSVPTPRNRRMLAARVAVCARITELIEGQLARCDDSALLARLDRARDETGRPMSAGQLVDEVITLWGAAHETSADAQAWTLYLLARHPHAAGRLSDEVDRVLGGEPVTAKSLPSLPYALAVFKESLRLYPPAAAMVRVASRDTTVGRYRVPAATILFISPYTLHRNADVWPDPDRFDPARFNARREKEIPKLAFLPFGAGAHVCLGAQLALLEGHALAATFAQHVRIDLTGRPPVPKLLVNLRPAEPLRARVHRRAPAR